MPELKGRVFVMLWEDTYPATDYHHSALLEKYIHMIYLNGTFNMKILTKHIAFIDKQQR